MKYRFLRFPEGRSKAVTLSYDDGCRADLRMVETINRYGMKCTFNINSDLIGREDDEWHLTASEIEKYLLGTGHEVAIHGAKHNAPGNLRAIDGIQDVLNGRLGLEKTFNRIIRGLAYPDSGINHFENGASYKNIRQYLKDLGIVYARTVNPDNDRFELPTDWYAWVPTAHHTNPEVLEYADRFLSMDIENAYCASRWSQLFYLWGHSFEFDNNDNWELLDAICEKLAGHEEIWYATNMEIYEYVTAYQSLVFSADNSRVYNPTLFTIWYDEDGTLYKIGPGETQIRE